MIRQNYSPCLIDNTILYISFFESVESGFIRSTMSLLEKFFRINLFMIDKYGFSVSRYGLLGPFHWSDNVGIEKDKRYRKKDRHTIKP